MRFVMISDQYTTYACHYTVRTHQIVLQKPDDQAHGKTFFFLLLETGCLFGCKKDEAIEQIRVPDPARSETA